MCTQLWEWPKNEEAASKQASAESTRFYVNGGKIERVTTFWYLGRLFADNDDDMACICTQIKKARTQWRSVARALKWDGADMFVMSRFYLAIVQAVLLYGSDS